MGAKTGTFAPRRGVNTRRFDLWHRTSRGRIGPFLGDPMTTPTAPIRNRKPPNPPASRRSGDLPASGAGPAVASGAGPAVASGAHPQVGSGARRPVGRLSGPCSHIGPELFRFERCG